VSGLYASQVCGHSPLGTPRARPRTSWGDFATVLSGTHPDATTTPDIQCMHSNHSSHAPRRFRWNHSLVCELRKCTRSNQSSWVRGLVPPDHIKSNHVSSYQIISNRPISNLSAPALSLLTTHWWCTHSPTQMTTHIRHSTTLGCYGSGSRVQGLGFGLKARGSGFWPSDV
jgi:hypothetical protein